MKKSLLPQFTIPVERTAPSQVSHATRDSTGVGASLCLTLACRIDEEACERVFAWCREEMIETGKVPPFAGDNAE
jgi:hypothetical protein